MKKFYIPLILIIWLYTPVHQVYASISIIDDWGRQVQLSIPASRVISLSPHLTELMFTAGAQNSLIGVSKDCNYPPQAKILPKVSDYQSINYELITMLNPDLILLWGSGVKNNTLAQIEKISPVYISQPKTFKDIGNNLIAIGKLTGHINKAHKEYEKFMHDISADVAPPEHSINLFYLLWKSPPMTASKDTWISQVIKKCGANNVFDNLKSSYPVINREVLINTPIDLIVHSLQLNDNDIYTLFRRKIETVYIQPDLIQRPTLRLVEGKKQLCNIIKQIKNQKKTQP